MIRYEGPEDQGNRGVFAVDERLYPWGIQDHTLIIWTVLQKITITFQDSYIDIKILLSSTRSW